MYELRKFVAPEFIFGVGARHEVGRYALNFGARRALVVTDPGVIDAGWASWPTILKHKGSPTHFLLGSRPIPGTIRLWPARRHMRKPSAT